MPIFNPMLVWGGIKLVSIDITNPPNNVNYQTGQSFDPAGMEVTATYSNGATLLATGWTYSPNGALTEETQSITIVYTEGGVSAQATQTITVQREDSFADSEWSEIIAACQSGSVPDSWGVAASPLTTPTAAAVMGSEAGYSPQPIKYHSRPSTAPARPHTTGIILSFAQGASFSPSPAR